MTITHAAAADALAALADAIGLEVDRSALAGPIIHRGTTRLGLVVSDDYDISFHIREQGQVGRTVRTFTRPAEAIREGTAFLLA